MLSRIVGQSVAMATSRPVCTVLDPVHGRIECSDAEDALMKSPFVERLKRVSQLGVTSVAFPGATHTRFSHSVGAMHLAGVFADHLFSDRPEDERKKLVTKCRVAALLHDVGHGPWSHTWDRVVYSKMWPGREKGHDEQRINIVLESSVSALIDACGIGVMDVVDAWSKEPFRSIVQGDMGADRLDYIFRDAHFALGPAESNALMLPPYQYVIRVIRDSSIVDSVLTFGEASREMRERLLRFREQVLYGSVYGDPGVVEEDRALSWIIEGLMESYKLVDWCRDMDAFRLLDESLLTGMIMLEVGDISVERLTLVPSSWKTAA